MLGLFLRRTLLQCHQRDDQQEFENTCFELIEKARHDKYNLHSAGLSIERIKSDSKWDMHIRTIDKKNRQFAEGEPELVLLLQAPAYDNAPSQSRLIEMFGVTKAEAKLIGSLVDGKPLTEAAKLLGVSRNTARAQLSSVFTKTGVNRQTHLIKLVADAFAKHW